jgi:hypothetical protein
MLSGISNLEWKCVKKRKSTPPNTIHRSRVFYKVLWRVMQDRLIKTLYTLSRSHRGSRDLQLWLLALCAL